MLSFTLKDMCEGTRVSVWVPERVHTSCPEEGGVGQGFTLEPFQLLMHYRQIGPQIGLFAVDWHHTEMTSPLKWRGGLHSHSGHYLSSSFNIIHLCPGYGFNLLNNARVLHLPLEKWMSPTSYRGASCTLLIKKKTPTTIFPNASWHCLALRATQRVASSSHECCKWKHTVIFILFQCTISTSSPAAEWII